MSRRRRMFCLYTIMPEAEIGMANTTTINFYEYFAFFKFRFVFFNLFKSLVGAHHLPLMYFMIIVHDYKFEFSYKTAVPCPPPIHADAIPYLTFRRFISWEMVRDKRPPVAASGDRKSVV